MFCTQFGVHGQLGNLQQLYNDGHAAFVQRRHDVVEPIPGRGAAAVERQVAGDGDKLTSGNIQIDVGKFYF